MMLTPFAADATDEKTASFVAKYEEKCGVVPNQFAADAYDAHLRAGCCLREGGRYRRRPLLRNACDMLIAAFQEIQVEGLTGTMTWSDTGAVTKTPIAVVIKDGAYVSAE